jgi:hypothetical protein
MISKWGDGLSPSRNTSHDWWIPSFPTFNPLSVCSPFSGAPETGGNIHHKSPFKCFLKCFLNDERVSFRRVALNITVEILHFLHLTLCRFAPFSGAPETMETGGNIHQRVKCRKWSISTVMFSVTRRNEMYGEMWPPVSGETGARTWEGSKLKKG